MEALGSTRTIELTKLAMDGLLMRQQAISTNTANVNTPDYQRKQVAFEDQLRNIIQKEDLKSDIRRSNSAAMSYQATSLDQIQRPTDTQMSILNQNSFQAYKPEIISDMADANPETGNNVEIEKEMMDMAKTGTQYAILANLESKMLSGLSEVIKGTTGA